jgi:hypothetical protein
VLYNAHQGTDTASTCARYDFGIRHRSTVTHIGLDGEAVDDMHVESRRSLKRPPLLKGARSTPTNNVPGPTYDYLALGFFSEHEGASPA